MMDKTVGNIIVLSMLLLASSMYAQVTLRASDLRGKTLQEVVVGVPFKLELAVEGEDEQVESQTIDGLAGFVVTGKQTHVMSINNVRTTKLIVSAYATKPGSYTVGPARIKIKNQEQQSSTVTFKVVAQETQKSSDAKVAQEKTDLFMRLSCSKQRVVVGEKIIATLSVYCAQEDTHIQQITEPMCDGLRVKIHKGPTLSKQMVNGNEYTCACWEWDLIPEKTGPLVIPALCGDFKIPLQDEDNGGFSVYSFIMGPVVRPKRVYSNAVTIDVEPLPNTAQKIQAVGNFTSYTARLNPAKACVGEGIVLTLTVQGTGDMSALETPQLVGMPDGLKWYESKNYVETNPNGSEKKCFEYIVQGLNAGNWEIPSQEFIYFDTHMKKQMTLATDMHTVTITQERVVQQAAPVDNAQEKQSALADSQLAPLNTVGPWIAQDEPMMPWWLFAVLAFAPGIFGVRSLLQILSDRYKGRIETDYQRKKYAFVRAHKAIDVAKSHNNWQQMYHIFLDFFAARLSKPEADITKTVIESYFVEKGFSQYEITAWHRFFAAIEAAAYGNEKTTFDAHSFDQAYRWLNILEKRP